MERPPSRAWLAAWYALALLVGGALVVAADRLELGGFPPENGLAALSAVASAALIRTRARDWPARDGIAILLALVAFAMLAFGLAEVLVPRIEPGQANAFYLVLLLPIGWAGRAEFRAHFEPGPRRDTGLDVVLLAVGATAIAYPFVRPIDAGPAGSVTAFTFLAIAATILAIVLALALWVPTSAHRVLVAGVAPIVVATTWLGTWMVRGLPEEHPIGLEVLWFAGPLALAASMTLMAHGEPGQVRAPSRLARPIVSSVAAIMAATGLAIVTTFAGPRQIPVWHTTLFVVALVTAIVVRLLANQIAAARAHLADRSALHRRDQALTEADRALRRVRETNDTLRRSEEHLRSVFEAAVDGFVELDEDGTVLLANEAFARMVGLDRIALEGQRWISLAASIEGADADFADLPSGGTARLHRTDGGPVHLESRSSHVPTRPPRRLVLIRDVTMAKVSEQTIRSLLQFLQDRDEDRTRLLRRTNAAIEQERNRIARDLHDGPVQGVSAAAMSLEAALLLIDAGDVERGVEMLTLLRQEISAEADDLRRLMSGLRPPVLEERGLIPALRETLGRLGAEHSLSTEFAGTMLRDVPDDLETLAYRVVQEALSNVVRHSGAARVIVRLTCDQNTMRIEVEDDGVGFDASQARDFLRSGRVGLATMRERVELASGTFAVRSSPGSGTAVMATIPLDAAMAVSISA